jgi:hypothetical protein
MSARKLAAELNELKIKRLGFAMARGRHNSNAEVNRTGAPDRRSLDTFRA